MAVPGRYFDQIVELDHESTYTMVYIILRSTDSEVPLGATRVDAAGVARSGAGVDDR